MADRSFIAAVSVAVFAAVFAAQAEILVDSAVELGSVKPMNAVNNGPKVAGASQTAGNDALYAAAKIPFARTHDANFCSSYGAPHTVDITAVFPDFSKDENDPASYDFAMSDNYLRQIREAGTEPFYRLGQSIEHGVKKYGVLPPKDFAKWARICEHVIRHYNEGWADGFKWNVRYWEIWNEPDLDVNCWKTNPRCWGGSEELFREFFRAAAPHLKKCFPDLKIGGPALAGDEAWGDRFLANMSTNSVPLDFFSWHIYARTPEEIAKKALRIRKTMDRHGYGKAESILNEWNYVKGWSKEFVYSMNVIRGGKGAAFTAATMIVCQSCPVDMLMYYDARPRTGFNGLFEQNTYEPLKGYYPFYAWSKLAALGTQVKTSGTDRDVYAAAAKNKDGKLGILVCRYSDDDNVCGVEKIGVRLASGSLEGAECHLTDESRLFTEYPFAVKDGALELLLEPNAFVLIEK